MNIMYEYYVMQNKASAPHQLFADSLTDCSFHYD